MRKRVGKTKREKFETHKGCPKTLHIPPMVHFDIFYDINDTLIVRITG
jgi:hypothetical protein